MARSRMDFFEILSGFYLLFVLMLIVLIAAIGDHRIFMVLLGLFPTVLTIMLSLVLHEQYAKQAQILWFLPILTSGLFFLIELVPTPVLGDLDIPVLTGVNFILSVVYVLIVFGLFKKHTPKTQTTSEAKPAEKEIIVVEKEQTIEDYVHSIEDKSKALNFVVGRVYNKYHGGTAAMREKLRIPSEWYNEFSLIGFGSEHIDYAKLNEIIAKFEVHLKNYEKTESELFKGNIKNLKNLIRELDGSEKVIDVLDHNDKDPVRSYYEGAMKFCTKIREEMEKQEVSLVENKYVPKTEEEEEELKDQSGAVYPQPVPIPKKEKKELPKPPTKEPQDDKTVQIKRPKTGSHP